MLRNRGITFKLVFLVLAGAGLIFGGTFLYSYQVSHRLIARNIEKDANNLVLATVNRIDRVLAAVQKVPQSMALFLENTQPEGGRLNEILRFAVEKNPEIFGAAIAFEPYAYASNIRAFAPYCYKGPHGAIFKYLAYEYVNEDWYQIPRELGRPVWSEPYYDEGGGNIVMATYSVPLYREIMSRRTPVGVVTADISLEWLQKMVASIKIAESGYGFLISKNGTYITHPMRELVMNETIFSVAEARGEAKMRQVGQRMIRGETGYTTVTSVMTGKPCWMVYAPIPSSGWSLGVLFPQNELMADIDELNRHVIAMVIAGLVLLLAVIVLIARSITRPLRMLTGAAADIATGNLDTPLPRTRDRDEVGRLTESFAHMQDSLKRYIRELTETTAAKEKIESELRIARDIQMGILPKAFPRHATFEICASLEPAREVGGDLYDFFFMDERHLCFTIGDVSGKGVPAALFMAITQTLVKTKAAQGLAPHAVLSSVNKDLILDNPSLMFVTLFMGILDIETGEVVYTNGGHNPPYVVRRDGAVEPLEGTSGIALGIEEDADYRSKKVTLGDGDMLFLYTDGVTEAVNEREELYAEDRLKQELARVHDLPVGDMIEKVMAGVRAFAGQAPQADDITVMVLRFKGYTTCD